MMKAYEYNVGNFKVKTREAARIIQRSLRRTLNDGEQAPRIIQTVIIEKVIR